MNNQILNCEETRQQAVFRALLQAMSRPGSRQGLPEVTADDCLWQILDCLFDQEVSFCLTACDSLINETIIRRWNAQPVDVDQADFLIATEGSSRGLLETLPRGTPDYPDRAATVLYQVDSFGPGGIVAILTGPGIKELAEASFHGLDLSEPAALRNVNKEFPLGVDAIFVSRDGEVLCIPRSTRIGE